MAHLYRRPGCNLPKLQSQNASRLVHAYNRRLGTASDLALCVGGSQFFSMCDCKKLSWALVEQTPSLRMSGYWMKMMIIKPADPCDHGR